MCILKKYFLFTLIFLYSYPHHISANTKVQLKPVIVQESGFTTDVYNPIIPIYIITKDDIVKKQPINTFTLLNKIPGINVDRSSARGNISSVFFRNAEANFTSIYIDGIKVNNPTNSRGGGYNFSLLDVNAINQIEVAKGPSSSIGGSDALAGIINISTFGAYSDTTSINRSDIRYGSGGYYNLSLRAAETMNQYQYNLYVSNSNDGISSDGSNFKLDTINFLIRKDDNVSSLKLKINSTNSFSSYFPDDSGGIILSEKRDLEHKKSNGKGISINFKKKFNSLINYNIQGSYYYEQEDLKSPGVNPGIGNASGISKNSSDSRYTIYSLYLNNNFKLSDNFSLITGLDVETAKSIIDSDVAISGLAKDSRKRTTYSPLISAKYNVLSNAMFLASFRFNFTKDFNDNISPKIGFTYKFNEMFSTSISWGKGFKLPSFYSLGNALVGNSNLIPEKSDGIEFNFSGRNSSNKIQYDLTLFTIKYKNLIDFDSTTFSLVNRSKLNTDGIELSAKYFFSNSLSVSSHATYIHSDLDVANAVLRHRPDWKGGINLEWVLKPNLYINLDSTYTDDRYDSSVVTGNRVLSSYTKFDLSTHYKINSYIDFSLSIDNLFDKNYQESIGFLARGITPKATLSIKF